MLPLWLSPTQVRLIPVKSEYLQDCLKLLNEFEKNEIRADIDDRDESLDKKIRDAETEWIPYVIVYGERERKSGMLSVRIREEGGGIRRMKPEELIKEVREKTRGKPFKKLPLPKLLSARPSFR